MQVVVSLRQLSTYADRFHVFLELSNHVERLFLITEHVDEASRAFAQNFPRFEFVEIELKRYAKESTAWLVRHVVESATPTIVHSTFGPLVQFFEMYAPVPDRTFRLVHSQYTANHDWFSDVRLTDYPMSFNYLGQRVKSFWQDRRMAWNVDGLLVMCPGHRGPVAAAHGLPLSKVFEMSSEVNSDFYGAKDLVRTTSRRIVFAGACYKNKGLDLILDALPAVFKAFPDLEVDLYGNAVKRQTSWLMDALLKVSACGVVKMKGRVDKERLRAAFLEADLLVSASRFEGSPRAVREAMSTGCPVLLSEIPGHLGLDPDGKYIEFVSESTPEAWSAAMIRCLSRSDETWSVIANEGKAAMHERHRPAAVAREILGIYEQVL